jgi:hypothetical protein
MRELRICALALVVVSLAVVGVAVASTTNRIGLSVPAYVVHSRTYTYAVTVSGYSRKRAIAYLFLDYSRCARSFAAEHRLVEAKHEAYDYYGVRGKFTEVSNWRSPYGSLTDHACAYLVSRASGALLARAHVSFLIH